MLNTSQISARDRRSVAIHEAGHAVMAQYLGLTSFNAEIHEVQAENASFQKTWAGSVRCEQHIEPKARIMVAVAGLVAETCWSKGEFLDLVDSLEGEPALMSDTDWKKSGCAFGQASDLFWDAVELAFKLMDRDTGQLWSELLREARRLIVESRPMLTAKFSP